MTPQALPSIEQALRIAAYIVVRHGDVYAPIMERLERELTEERGRVSSRDRAKHILQREVRNVLAG